MGSTIGLESLGYCAHSLGFNEKRQLVPLRLFRSFPDTVWVPSSGPPRGGYPAGPASIGDP
jgi:hypothetical protein